MAGGTRQVVSDPLDLNPNTIPPLRQIETRGVQNPNVRSPNLMQDFNSIAESLDGLMSGVASAEANAIDDARTEGKIGFMQGKTEAEIAKSGNRYTMQGYQALNTVDRANMFYQQEMTDMSKSRNLTPDQYRAHLKQRNASFIENLPQDPAIRKLHVAAYDDVAPRLAAEHAKQHNAYNEEQTITGLQKTLISTSSTAPDRAVYAPSAGIAVSGEQISQAVSYNAEDRDLAIRTILGEAGGEGAEGMAAVAHVIRNRTLDGGYGGNTVRGVVMAPSQFSVWNSTEKAGGIPSVRKISADSPAYIKAGEIFDAVIQGRTVDSTNGATHYYSPQGMKKLVADGYQSNTVPSWYAAEAAKGNVQIGNHLFAGRARSGQYTAPAPTPLKDAQAPLVVSADAAPEAVATAEGIPTNTTTLSGNTQAQQLILSQVGIPPEKRALAVVDAVIQDLANDSTGVFDSIGGLGFLGKIGATPEQMLKVKAAKESYDKRALGKYDIDKERKRAELMERVEQGSITPEEARTQLKEMVDSNLMSDSDAQSLARKVASDQAIRGQEEIALKPEVQKSLGNIYADIRRGLPVEDLIPKLDALASEHGMSRDLVNRFLKSMYAEQEAQTKRDSTKLVETEKRTKQNQYIKDQVAGALGRGYGADKIQGNITTFDEQGNKVLVSAQQYAIDSIRENEGKRIDGLIESGQISPEARGPALDKVLYETLAKQNIVDTKFGTVMAAAATGNVMQGTEPSEAVLASADFYIRNRDNPNIGPTYMARMVQDEDARTFYETVHRFNDGRPDSLVRAVTKAHEYLNRPINEQEIQGAKGAFFAGLNTAVNKVTDKLNNKDTFYGRWIQQIPTINEREAEWLQQDASLRQYITDKAITHKMKDTRIPNEVAMEKAVQDTARDTVIVLGKPLIGDSNKGQRIDQVMDLQSPEEVNSAVKKYLMDNADNMWPDEGEGVARLAIGAGDTRAIDVNYNPSSRTITVQRYKEVGTRSLGSLAASVATMNYLGSDLPSVLSKRQPIGYPFTLSVDDISKHYKETYDEQAGPLASAWDSVLDSWADTSRQNRDMAARQRQSPSDQLRRQND